MKQFALLMIFLAAIACVSAQTDDVSQIKSKLPHLLGANNAGTEFFLTFHPNWEEVGGIKLKIYVSSAFFTEVRLTIPSISSNPILIKKVHPFDVAEFTLTPDQAQCYNRGDAGNNPPMPSQVFIGKGIIVESDAPIVCYGVSRSDHTSDGFLVLPVNVLGKKYKVASYSCTTEDTDYSQHLNGYTSVIGTYDNTTVDFTLHGNPNTYILDENKDTIPNGKTLTRKLNRGDVWLIAARGAFGDLSSSLVNADKPFALISGNYSVQIPLGIYALDYTIEQEIPMNTWGSKYHIPSIYPRKVSPIIRIFPSAEITSLFRDNELFDTLSCSIDKAEASFIECRSTKDKLTVKPAVISADQPISITLYNTGQGEDDVKGDPFQLLLTPINQYSKNILFNTPGIKGGQGFADNYITTVYLADSLGRIPNDFRFGIRNDSTIIWQQVSDMITVDSGSFNDFDLESNREYKYLTLKLPEDGIYLLKSETAFGAYSYGVSEYDSYGFPAAIVLLTNNSSGNDKIGSPTITVDKGLSGSYSGVASGNNKANGGETVELSLFCMLNGESYNYEFQSDKLIPEKSNIVNWNLKVKDISLDAKAVILVTNRSGQDTVLIFRYNPSGVEESTKPDKYISVFPMPIRDKSTIVYECQEAGTADIELVDLNGKIVQSISKGEYLEKGNIRRFISANALPGSAYTLRISKNGKIETRALVIEK